MLTVLDFEFNQAFDFGNGNGEPNPNCRFEIIQIGALKLDDNYNIVDKFVANIKPSLYKRIHPYVEKITGLTDNDFKDAPDFITIYKDFRNFIADSMVLGTWGYSDIKALFRNVTFYNIIKPPVIIEYVDIQKIATQYLKYSKGGTIGLKNAVEALDIKIDENMHFHNALSDAYYTSMVLKKINPDNLPVRIFNSKHIK
jgi:hypothetical protein